jgi:hypothetical protein
MVHTQLVLIIQHTVRNEAFTAIGKLYRLAYPEMWVLASYLTPLRHWYSWSSSPARPTNLLQSNILPGSRVRLSALLPQRLIPMFGKLHLNVQILRSHGVHVKPSSTAEQTLSKYILPLPAKGDDEVAWTEQLLVTIRHLDYSGLAALIVLSNIGLSYDAWARLE